MRARQLIARLASEGGILWADGARLMFRAIRPKGCTEIDPEFISSLKVAKDEIMQVLSEEKTIQ